jgi:hypothetical protein
MLRRRVISFAALFAVLGGIGLLVAISAKGPGPQGPMGPADSGSPAEPEVILRNVVMREVRKEGAQYRLSSERATYLLLAGRVSATGVTLGLPGAAGELIVRAPKASCRTGRSSSLKGVPPKMAPAGPPPSPPRTFPFPTGF